MKSKGFSLLEVMFSALVMVALLVGVLSLYISCLNLQEAAKNSSRASFQLSSMIEEIKGTNFNNINATYNNQRLDLEGLDGEMLVEVTLTAQTFWRCGLLPAGPKKGKRYWRIRAKSG